MLWNVCTAVMLIVPQAAPSAEDDLERAIAVVRSTGSDGKKSEAAARAWRDLAQTNAAQLPMLLAGMDGANSVARNWLRSAVAEVVERARAAKQSLPVAALERFVQDSKHDPRARRLAYELIVERDKTAADRFLPHMLDDPNSELRRDAVARVLDQAEKRLAAGDKQESLPQFQTALAAARDKDQLDKAAARLRELGHPVDMPTHLGLILDWKLIGPFPNADQKGCDTVYPPEMEINRAAEYDGTSRKVRWQDYVSKSDNGVVDVHQSIGKQTQAVAYALTEFTSDRARPVEIRLGCYVAFKLWVNGELVLVRGDAYTGMRMDHYVSQAPLKPGKNSILMKLCQDNAPPPVPNDCKFLLRVCDTGGVAVLSTTRPAPPPKDSKTTK